MDTTLLIIVAFALVSGSYTSVLASAKGYNAGMWFFGGLCFSPIALITIAGMPMKD